MVDSSDLIKVAESLPPGILEQVYKDMLQPGAQQAGKAIGTVLGLANTALVPIEWINERCRLGLARNLETYRQKMEHVPVDSAIPVRPEIGVPIIEKLSYYTDETLSELFINLLATASAKDTVHLAHPGFIRVIEHLSPDEARLLLQFKESDWFTYIVLDELREEFPEISEAGSFYFGAKSGLTLDYSNNLEIYEANLEGLGLLAPVIPPHKYDRDEGFDRIQQLVHELSLDIHHPQFPVCWGYMMITPYGRMFVNVCTSDMT